MVMNSKIQIISGQAQGLTIANSVRKARVPRRPAHTFNLVQYPYEITPFMIAPVLAGETMKNLLLQCRTVSTAMENRLIGAHLEHYFFYVKLRDLGDADDLVAMLMDTGSAAETAVNKASGTSVYKYVRSGAPDFVNMCLTSVVNAYFRDEGDTASHVGSVTGLPMAMYTNKRGILDSLIADADMPTDTVVDTTAFPDFEQEQNAWAFMRQMGLTELSFEDYLGTFGVRSDDKAESRPEVIRMVKNWTYPTNTLDGDGTINSQCSWSVAERADKDRFFKEPGFIFGATIARPKVYLGLQDQASVSLLGSAFSWLPAMMKDTPFTSLVKELGNSPAVPFKSADIPAGGELDEDLNYWFDVRDLFLYGDQFVNRTQGAAVNNSIVTEDLTDFHGKKYPSSASLQLIGKSDTLTYESDGIVSLNILGTQVDNT